MFVADVLRPRQANALFPQTWLVISTAAHAVAAGAVWLYYNTTKGTKEYHQVQSSQSSSQSGYMEVTLVPYKETVPVPASINKTYSRNNGTTLTYSYSGLPGNGSIYFVATYDAVNDKLVYASTSSGLSAAGWVLLQSSSWCSGCGNTFNSAMDSASYNGYTNTRTYNQSKPYDAYMIVGVTGNPPVGYIGGNIEVWMRPSTVSSSWEIDYQNGELVGGISHVMQASGPDNPTSADNVQWTDTNNTVISTSIGSSSSSSSGSSGSSTGSTGSTGGSTSTGSTDSTGSTTGTTTYRNYSGVPQILTENFNIPSDAPAALKEGDFNSTYDLTSLGNPEQDIKNLALSYLTSSPILSNLKNSKLNLSNPLCKLDGSVFGSNFSIDFCVLEPLLALFGAAIMIIASWRALFIAFGIPH